MQGDYGSQACVTCPPPRLASAAPTLAERGHVTCGACTESFRDRLAEVAERFLRLDPRPGANAIPGMRGAPGFGSRSPASDHVIAMRDVRSSHMARVWVGGDGRVHEEASRPARNVHATLSTVAWSVAEHRGVSGPDDRADVFELVEFLGRHVDYISRHAGLAVELDRALGRLTSALRPVTGDGRRRVGSCPIVVTDPALVDPSLVDAVVDVEPIRCRAPLYAPRTLDGAIVCAACGSSWSSSEWLKLGDELNAEVLRAVC